MDEAIAQICEGPVRWPGGSRGTRRFTMSSFPYHVVYRVAGRRVEVVAFAHASRRPDYWRGR